MHINSSNKYKCPCCSYFTLDHKPNNTFELCPGCFWEDDAVQLHDPSYEGGANTMSLNQAKENYSLFGVIDERFREFVRAPTQEELAG